MSWIPVAWKIVGVLVLLRWFFCDAADEAGLSRRYGGIHPALDDYPGRVIGHQVGVQAMERALTHFGRL